MLSSLRLSLLLLLSLIFNFTSAHAQEPSQAPHSFYLGSDANKPITFGLEIELDPLKSNVLDFYRPSGVTDEEWKLMSTNDKKNYFFIMRERENFYYNDYHRRVKENFSYSRIHPKTWKDFFPPLQLLKSVAGPYPETLDREISGTYEFRGQKLIFKTDQELHHFLQLFKQTFGEGDIQGHVVFPIAHYPGILGYIIFEHDRAFLQKLEQQQEELDHCQLLPPAGNLYSKSLKVMDQQVRLATESVLSLLNHRLKTGQDFEVMKYERAPRYNGPLVRTDGYPLGLMGLELREYDRPVEIPEIRLTNSYDPLEKTMISLAALLETHGGFNDFQSFESFQTTPPRYSMSLYDRERYGADLYPQRLEELRKSTHPSVKDRAQKLSTEDWDKRLWKNNIQSEVEEIYFKSSLYFPLRDWKNFPPLAILPDDSSKQELSKRIEEATLEYMEKVEALVQQYPQDDYHIANPFYKKEFLDQVRFLLTRWASKVKLSPFYHAFEQMVLTKKDTLDTDPID